MYNVHGMCNIYTILYLLGLRKVKENVYANHTASETSTRSGMSSSFITVMMSGRSDEISLKSISSYVNTSSSHGVECIKSILEVVHQQG